MTIPRIYFPQDIDIGQDVELDRESSHYLHNVMRLKKGEAVVLFGNSGFEYETELVGAGGIGLILKVLDRHNIASTAISVTLAQSLPKLDKMDLVVQKATELGAREIVPFISSRSIPVLNEEKARQRRERWQKIALEAARQCRRADVPEIRLPVPYGEMLDMAAGSDLRIILWEEESRKSIRIVLRENPDAEKIFIVIGPEGGFSNMEIDRAITRGFISTTLGKQVLKTETAGLAILTIIQYDRGIFDGTEIKLEMPS